MVMKIIGLVFALLGVFVNFGCSIILDKVLKVTEPTDAQRLKVKSVGLSLAVVGAVIVFFFT